MSWTISQVCSGILTFTFWHKFDLAAAGNFKTQRWIRKFSAGTPCHVMRKNMQKTRVQGFLRYLQAEQDQGSLNCDCMTQGSGDLISSLESGISRRPVRRSMIAFPVIEVLTSSPITTASEVVLAPIFSQSFSARSRHLEASLCRPAIFSNTREYWPCISATVAASTGGTVFISWHTDTWQMSMDNPHIA